MYHLGGSPTSPQPCKDRRLGDVGVATEAMLQNEVPSHLSSW